MRIVKAALVCGTAALVLAGCNRKDGEGQAKPGAEQAAPARPAPVPKTPTPVDTPRRKAGLWEQRISQQGVDFVQVNRLCLDNATDVKLSWWGNQGPRALCEKNLISRHTDGTWRFSSVCDMGSGGVTTTSGVASGDFSSHYMIKAESSTTGAAVPQMNGQRAVTIEAQRQGPCPAGMKPGDMEIPGGKRVNILDLQVPSPG